jgi:hypothetical protein
LNSKFSKYIKLRKSISKEIIVAIPCYNQALVSISKLLNEIVDIKFLPQEEYDVYADLRKKMEAAAAAAAAADPNGENNTLELINRVKLRKSTDAFYSLDAYLKKTSEMNKKSDEMLDYFFAYVKYVLDHTRQRMYDKLRFYEILVHQISPSEISKSIHQQHNIQAQREAELAKVQQQIG